ncbi:unnamed protein product, partial [Mesorhabditis spiculigera]
MDHPDKSAPGASVSFLPVDPGCVVCEGPAHGTHFGVPACRACAAFFRRSYVLGRDYKCRKQTGRCNISKDTRFLCRGCRLEKCIRLGMTPDNVQCDKETLPAPSKARPQKAEMEEKPLELPETSGTPDKPFVAPYYEKEDPPEVKVQACAEVDRMTKRVEDILTAKPPSLDTPFHLTALQKMTIATQKLRAGINPNPEVLPHVTLFTPFHRYWQKMLEDWATWMMHCDEFAQLELDQKFLILKHTWSSLTRLDKISISIDAFGEEAISRRKCYMTKDHCVTRDTTFDTSAVSTLDYQELYRSVAPILEQAFEEVARPLLNHKVTHFEFVFLMSLSMWNVETWGVSEATLRAAETFRERISNELHDYYVHSMNVTNYAYRLLSLISIVRANEKVQQSRGDLLQIFRLFDLLRIDFPPGELFDWKRM